MSQTFSQTPRSSSFAGSERQQGIASTERAQRLDARDPLRSFRASFDLPEQVLYFDGNSLGPLSVSARQKIIEVVDCQWRNELILAWERRWRHLPAAVAAKIAPLIGAAPDEVTVGDSTSINLFKALAAALDSSQSSDKKGTRLLCEPESFPTNLYIATALCESLEVELCLVSKDQLANELGPDVAAVCLNHVDYRSGEISNIAELTARIHESGAIAIWDVSHSVGILELEMDRWQVDLAVGCTYKFLNGGPGSPAFLFAARHWHHRLRSPIPGWFGHRDPFEFSPTYEPSAGISRFDCGTPSIVALAALDGALDLFAGLDLLECRQKLAKLSDLLITEIERSCPGFELISPRDSRHRGAHVAWRHAAASDLVRRLADAGLIVDYRPPDIIRFGLAPLYLRFIDVVGAAGIVSRTVAEIQRA